MFAGEAVVGAEGASEVQYRGSCPVVNLFYYRGALVLWRKYGILLIILKVIMYTCGQSAGN